MNSAFDARVFGFASVEGEVRHVHVHWRTAFGHHGSRALCVQGDGLMPATGGSVALGKTGITFQRMESADPALVRCGLASLACVSVRPWCMN